MSSVLDFMEIADQATAQRDAAYNERNRLVALLASMLPSVQCRTAIEGWDPEWHNCVYITSPTGQMSWHFHDDDARLFAQVPEIHVEWDGHTTETKYVRVEELVVRYWQIKSLMGVRIPK